MTLPVEDAQYPEEVGLTSEEKYGKTYVSRVTERDDKVISPSMESHDDHIVFLPRVAHEGMCFLKLRLGEPVDNCPCLSPLMAELELA